MGLQKKVHIKYTLNSFCSYGFDRFVGLIPRLF